MPCAPVITARTTRGSPEGSALGGILTAGGDVVGAFGRLWRGDAFVADGLFDVIGSCPGIGIVSHGKLLSRESNAP
jgi:hypothetical protein